MKKIFAILCGLFFIVSCSKKDLMPLKIETSDGTIFYKVEVASKSEDLAKGLMYRDHLSSDHGMLFLFDEKHPQPVAMWMKNTYIPLDMLFLNKSNIIVAVYENAQPMSLKLIRPQTKENVFAVIELNAGDIKKHHIKVGDKVLY